jgi:hypothetical protein
MCVATEQGLGRRRRSSHHEFPQQKYRNSNVVIFAYCRARPYRLWSRYAACASGLCLPPPPLTPLTNPANFLLPAKERPIISSCWLCSVEDEFTNRFVPKGSAALIACSELYEAVFYVPQPYSNVYLILLTGYTQIRGRRQCSDKMQKRNEPL